MGGHSIEINEEPRHVVAVIDGTKVAESDRPRVLYETGLPPRYYLPKDDVRMELFRPTDTRTHCPFKGDASYWTATIDGREHPDVMWGYEDPIAEAREIAGCVCFYDDKVELSVG